MAREFNRSDRVADSVQRSLGKLIPMEIRDPRLGMVNINEVEVSRDLANAKIYVTFIGQDDEKKCEDSVEVLNNASSYLRSLMGKELSMRVIPSLQFFYDRTSVRGQELSRLIDQAVASDKANATGDDDQLEDEAGEFKEG